MLQIEIGFDSDVDSPNSNYGWRLYSFIRKHNSFKALDSFDYPIRNKIDKGQGYWLSYYEHSNCWWGRSNGKIPAGVEFDWDGVRIGGVLIWEENEPAPGPESADAFLIEYNDWANGRCFYFNIKDQEGNIVDGCGGLIGQEWACQHIAECILVGSKFYVTGECSFLEDDILKNFQKRTMLAVTK